MAFDERRGPREGGYGGGHRGGGGGYRGGGGRGPPSGPREMHDATCSKCGKETQVPFKPAEDRPVYCRDCFAEVRPPRRF